MKAQRMALVELHAAVILFGLAGLFPKIVGVGPAMLVLGRTAFAAVSLGLLLAVAGRRPPLPQRRNLLAIVLSGLILAFHWVAFFRSIQVSSVAVGLLSYSCFPLFVTLLEPWLFRERLRTLDLATAALVLAGLVCMVPQWDFANAVTQGVAWGAGSGLAFAFLALLNRRLVRGGRESPMALAAGQNGAAAVALLLLLPTYAEPVTVRQAVWLGVLGIACTAVSHSLFIKSLRHLRAQLASVVAGLEAVYGAIFALVFLGEVPTARTVAGGLLILSAVSLGTWYRRPAGATV